MALCRVESPPNKYRLLWYMKIQQTWLKKLTKPQDGDVNPFTKQPHSAQYKKILQVRKKLPVYVQMTKFYEMVSPSPRSEAQEGRSEPASEPLKGDLQPS